MEIEYYADYTVVTFDHVEAWGRFGVPIDLMYVPLRIIYNTTHFVSAAGVHSNEYCWNYAVPVDIEAKGSCLEKQRQWVLEQLGAQSRTSTEPTTDQCACTMDVIMSRGCQCGSR